MQQESPFSVLAIISNRIVFNAIKPFLARSNLEVSRATNASDGLGACRSRSSDLVVAQHPLSGFSPQDFFDAYYREGSASADAPLLVVTRSNREAEVRSFLQGKRARTCRLESTHDGHLHQALYELVGVSARCSSRLLVTADVDFGESSVQRVFQTVNISKTGFLLRAQRAFDLGTVLSCRLQLPHLISPLEAIVEVVRITDPDAEGIRGFGVRILDFEGEGRQLLDRFVEGRLTLPTPGR